MHIVHIYMPFQYLFTTISLYECAWYVLSHICMPDLSKCMVTLYIISASTQEMKSSLRASSHVCQISAAHIVHDVMLVSLTEHTIL